MAEKILSMLINRMERKLIELMGEEEYTRFSIQIGTEIYMALGLKRPEEDEGEEGGNE